MSAPLQYPSDAGVVSLLDRLRSKRSHAQACRLERLLDAMNEIVAAGALPAL